MRGHPVRNLRIHNYPQDVEGLPRRNFIARLLGGAAAAVTIPSSSWGRSAADLWKDFAREEYVGEADASYWAQVKTQFMIRKDLLMLNAANLCPSPYAVQQRVFELTRDIDSDPSSINRRKFSRLREESRKALADYLGADPEEIAITRNTSEGNNIVISGLTFESGDEVIIWDENHPTANIAWDVRAERYGFVVKRVKIPPSFSSGEELIRPFRAALTPKTRIICFSHVSNISGIALPAQELCRMARENGVLTHIDGAQTFGSEVVKLHEIGCDYYTGSAHKWFVGPKEVGVLYVRRERIAELWPSIVGVGYPGAEKAGAKKFETLGQRDDSRIAAMATTVEFHNIIGGPRIQDRIKKLAAVLKQSLRDRIPHVRFHTPIAPEFSGGVVVFQVPGIDLDLALNTLYHEHRIGCAVFGGDLAGIRLCPHIYNTLEEMDRAADAVAALR